MSQCVRTNKPTSAYFEKFVDMLEIGSYVQPHHSTYSILVKISYKIKDKVYTYTLVYKSKFGNVEENRIYRFSRFSKAQLICHEKI